MSARRIVILVFMVVFGLQTFIGGCTNYNRQRGVENTWRKIDLSEIVPGKTSQMEIAKKLGPPSQIINLNHGTVFYYLAEQTRGGGAIFIIFNTLNEKTTYDRAVFFFDENGVLSEYSLSHEAIGDDQK
ncbi:outer membrane protein assembly factor BamE [Desulfovibrio sp. Fe33]|uniref:outer membrane protein assembly factor BamE n=1 Tax=Desulfovibrio sp. Fe33 TaxID=3020842 RepID=UPI00234E138A|nr:outer membrane protein assembly factor BamE [Desulfovibrio sp. Fe33]